VRVAFVTANAAGRTGGALRGQGLVSGLMAHGVSVTTLPAPRGANRAYGYIGKSLTLDERFDIVHLDGLYLAPLCRSISSPTVIDICDSPIRTRVSVARTSLKRRLGALPGLALTSALLVQGLRRADAAIYISAEDAEADRPWHRLGGASIFVVPNGVAADLLCLPPFASRARREPYRVVMAADWSYPPNIDGLRWFLGSVWPLALEHCSVLRMVLYGPEAPEMALPSGVTFAGFAESVSDVYREADVVVAPLLSGGGIKNKVLEAICAGRPIVGTPVAFVGIDQSVTSHARIEDTPAAFAAALVEEALRPRLGVYESARQKIAERYTWEGASARLIQAYESVLSGPVAQRRDRG
jgi:glycosyltransferase involved in cell wall biosynthesis